MRKNNVQALAQTAVLLALLIVLGMVPAVPTGILPIPIVLQNLGVMLIALLLGPRWGSAAMVAFFALVAAGLPVLSGGRGGLAVLSGPTAGYLLAWALTPVLVFACQRLLVGWSGKLSQPLALWLGAVASSYLLGTLVLVGQTHLPFWPSLWANWAFILGDTAKVVIALILYRAVQRFGLVKTGVRS
ncbi:biotin transporter BioY [Leuconostocaceae bacterium ESL0723]|nr:biotin transporter BioY [Leuconostocaceae bacterium ESL0723]